jgi:hypothetical protein
MKPYSTRFFKTVSGLCVFSALLCACGPGQPPAVDIKQYMAQPHMQVRTYGFDPKSSLESRIGPCPDFLLGALKNMDGRDDYKPYALQPAEKRLVLDIVASLPAAMRKAFQEKLLGIFFVENFTGNGMSNWVLDERRKVHAWIVINPASFEKSLSETLTGREASVFQGDAGVKVDCGTRYPGVLYTLLHEGLHAYDYVQGVTPYVERMVVQATRGDKGEGVSWDVWQGIQQPKPEADFAYRDKLHFYGLGGGAVIPAADAGKVYAAFKNTPFASLYGSLSWAEDAAELFVFHHITRVLEQPYAVRIKGKAAAEPMAAGGARERAERLYAGLYEP